MLAPARAGAHPSEHLVAPGPDVIAGWSSAAGVAMVTMAPELPGAPDVIEVLASRGVRRVGRAHRLLGRRVRDRAATPAPAT